MPSEIAASPPLTRRRVAQTDLSVTEIGLGAATIADLFEAVPDEQCRETVRAALDSGVGYVDTSPFYGFGKSEHLVGDVLRHRRNGVVLSTKVGRLLTPCDGPPAERRGWVEPLSFEPHYDYTYDGVMRSFADSQQRLGLSRIDMLYVHDIGTMIHGVETNHTYWRQLADGGCRALAELKAAGLVGAIGMGVNEWQVLMDALDLGDWDIFLLAGRYTLLDQSALSPLLARCLERGTSVVIGGPFNSGALMGTGRWNYRAAPAAILERVDRLTAFCRDREVNIGAAAIQMPLAHPAVVSVLCGPRSPTELAQVLAWAREPIAEAFWTELAEAGRLAPGTLVPGGKVAT